MDKATYKRWWSYVAPIAIAISCFCTLIVTWGNNWFMSGILMLGVIVCGTIGYGDMKQLSKKEH